MKVQLNFQIKTITLIEQVNLLQLVNTLKDQLKDFDQWSICNSEPQLFNPYDFSQPDYLIPYYNPNDFTITCDSETNN